MKETKRLNPKLTIAIDGPAGAGKSTVAWLLARRLGYLYIDTGAMYRALTLKALRNGLKPGDLRTAELARETDIYFGQKTPEGQQIFCDGQDVSAEIRSPEVSEAVSLVAKNPEIRSRMVELQRRMAAGSGVVMDGRDIGTVVLPQADCKFFITASLEERAFRRWKELREQGFDVDLASVEKDLALRDQIDSQREVAPLSCAPDATVIDTTGLSVMEVVALMADNCLKEK